MTAQRRRVNQNLSAAAKSGLGNAETVSAPYLKAEEMETTGEKRELIGQIRATQRFLKQPVSPQEDLMEHSLEELNAHFQDLQAELAELNERGRQ